MGILKTTNPGKPVKAAGDSPKAVKVGGANPGGSVAGNSPKAVNPPGNAGGGNSVAGTQVGSY